MKTKHRIILSVVVFAVVEALGAHVLWISGPPHRGPDVAILWLCVHVFATFGALVPVALD